MKKKGLFSFGISRDRRVSVSVLGGFLAGKSPAIENFSASRSRHSRTPLSFSMSLCQSLSISSRPCPLIAAIIFDDDDDDSDGGDDRWMMQFLVAENLPYLLGNVGDATFAFLPQKLSWCACQTIVEIGIPR
ncbi:hypothetical protein ACLOJK_033604 [Asimina triloba]